MTVHVEFLEKRFGDRREVVGVDKVSFTAKEHGITSLLGPSGSGKSTLLRLVAGLEVPDAGRVFIDGQDVTEVPVKDRQIGFVFQNYALFRHMSVFDNVAFGPSIQKKPKSEIADRVAELLSLVQLRGYEHRLPDQLSGGQRQRVALARALVHSPELLLLDEPWTGLDVGSARLLERIVLEERDRGALVLVVSHEPDLAERLGARELLLVSGRTAQSSSRR